MNDGMTQSRASLWALNSADQSRASLIAFTIGVVHRNCTAAARKARNEDPVGDRPPRRDPNPLDPGDKVAAHALQQPPSTLLFACHIRPLPNSPGPVVAMRTTSPRRWLHRQRMYS